MHTNIRSTLTPYWHKQRGKWYPRGTYPFKTDDGSIERRRGFVGSGSDTRAACQTDCNRLNAEYERLATAGPQEPTFEEAVLTYLSTGGDPRFLGDNLLDEIGPYRVNKIDDAVMAKVQQKLFPSHAPATINRQLYTPVISVLRLASEGKPWKPKLKRPKGWWRLKPAKAPGDDWFVALRREANPPMWAFLLFLTIHGRRPKEGFEALPEHFDPDKQTLLVPSTKPGDALLVRLSPPVVDAIAAYDWRKGPGLFGMMTWSRRRNAYRALKAACKRAGAPYITFHKAGRHKFAKRLLDAGYSLAHVKAAGVWNSMAPLSQLYGHLEHSEVAEQTKHVGQEWMSKLEGQGEVVPFQVQRQKR